MSYEGTKISPSRLPAATGSALGAVITGSNVTNTAGTISVTGGNVTTALGYTPEDAANKNAASGYAGLDASSLLTPAQIPFATGAVRGGVIVGTNITVTAGTISLTNGNVTGALGYTPLNKAGDTMTAGFLTLFQDPTSALHAATKGYVDGLLSGLDVKASVRAATTANITLSAPQTIDGVSVIAGNRVLVKDQTTASQNGIYVVAAGAWTRATDADSDAEVTAGLFTFVAEGTANGDTGWVLSTNDTITLNTTALTFTQFSSAGVITVSGTSALTKTGNALSVNVDNSSIEIATNALQIKALGVTAGMLAGSIPDTKLSTISTAGKVADTALSSNVALLSGTTAFTAKQTFFTSTTGAASINIPHGATPTAPANGDIWTTTAGLFARINGATIQFGTGTGSVTSVALSITGPLFTISGSPVTNSGTLTATLNTQSANLFFAGPATGAAAAPTFRALDPRDTPRAVRVVTAAGAITVTVTDDMVVVNKTTGAATAVTLPATPVTGSNYTIKDGKGDASTNAITVSPAAGTIDGAANIVIDQDYGARVFVYNGTQWNVL